MGIISYISLKIDFAGKFKTAGKQTSPRDIRSKLFDLQMEKFSERLSIHPTFFYMETMWLYSPVFAKEPQAGNVSCQT